MTSASRTIEEQSGATFDRLFFDVELPAHYGDVAAEWTAVRQACGLIDAGFRSLLHVTGSDRIDFLQGMLTNQIKTLVPGDGVHAAHLTAQGRVVADMRVLALEEEIWLDVPVQRRGILRQALERYLVADDVELVDDGAMAPLFSLEGPRSAEVATALFGTGLDALKPLSHVEREVDGARFRIVSATHTGERGFLVCGDTATAASLWQRCRQAGAAPVGMQALDILRVEAGIPWCDRDMDEGTLAPEVGLEDAISFTKGCYIGQEVVERVAARGQVQRKLMSIECDGSETPVPGTKLLRDGTGVGEITSAVRSFARHGVLALAYVRRSAWELGTTVQLEGGAAGTIAALGAQVQRRDVI